MTRELNLHDLQQHGLKITKVVDNWCTEHGVNYSLCGGSLIGAIRHKGFIPWDDDVDIAMPRPDYERFVHEFNVEGYVCVAPELGNSMISYARICDMRNTISKPYCPWCTIPDVGMWIDIFPIDGEHDDIDLFSQDIDYIQRQTARLYQLRGTKLAFSLKLGGVKIIKLIGKKLIYGRYNLSNELDKLLRVVKATPFGNTAYAGNLSYPVYNKNERSRTSVFLSYIRVPFEDTTLQVFADYDEYLRDIFGDYMQLPPENQRIPKHAEHKFYFKD